MTDNASPFNGGYFVLLTFIRSKEFGRLLMRLFATQAPSDRVRRLTLRNALNAQASPQSAQKRPIARAPRNHTSGRMTAHRRGELFAQIICLRGWRRSRKL